VALTFACILLEKWAKNSACVGLWEIYAFFLSLGFGFVQGASIFGCVRFVDDGLFR
jgi:hypothetical protein